MSVNSMMLPPSGLWSPPDSGSETPYSPPEDESCKNNLGSAGGSLSAGSLSQDSSPEMIHADGKQQQPNSQHHHHHPSYVPPPYGHPHHYKQHMHHMSPPDHHQIVHQLHQHQVSFNIG